MSLRDQMLKAGLISEDQAKQAAHKQRVDTKRADPAEREAQRRAAQQEAAAQKERERKRHKEQSRERNTEAAAREQTVQRKQRTLSAQETAYRDGAIPSWEGPRRYYFALQGRVELLMVTDDVSRKLEAGHAAIVAGERNPARQIPLLAGPARRLAEIAPERLLVLHEQAPSPTAKPEAAPVAKG